GIYHLPGDEKVRDLDVAHAILEHLGQSRESIRFAPAQKKDEHPVAADALLAETQLNWKPRKQFALALIETIDWYVRHREWSEKDEPRPISRYGESKLAGERALFAVSERFLAVRVSWVFGPDRASFLDQIIQRALTDERVGAIADKVSVPTYTLDAAGLLLAL